MLNLDFGKCIFITVVTNLSLREKCPNTELVLARIFL